MYHRPSGKTHLLNDASHHLLTELLRERKDLATIVAEFDPGDGSVETEQDLQRVRSMLFRLEQLGLIERL